MSKELFYRSMDRLNEAIAKAGSHLKLHPAGICILKIEDEDGILCLDDNDSDPSAYVNFGIGMDRTPNGKCLCLYASSKTSDWEAIDELRHLSQDRRRLCASFIPDLIRLADASAETKAEEVDVLVKSIDDAIEQSPFRTKWEVIGTAVIEDCKPKRITRKKS